MSPALRYLLFASAASVVAVVAGWQVAGGELVSLDLAGAITTAALLLALGATAVKLLGLPLDVILLGGVLIGYLVGNRGFAQLTPTGALPLFPAELTLAVALGWRLVVWAYQRESPLRRDALNYAVLAWLVAGTARLPFDLPRHGLTALRDYAMIYYALFFFIVQHMAQSTRARSYLRTCLLAGLAILPVAFGLSLAFPEFFLGTLVLRGAPLLYYKGDLALTFLAIGSFMLFFCVRDGHRLWARPLATGLFLYVISGGNRASMLGLAVGTGLLLLARQWRYAAIQCTATGLAGLFAVMLAISGSNLWAEKKIDGISDRLRSLADIKGTAVYQSDDSANKGDNNRFRLVWWRNVVEETWHTNPVFGLGFGHDLTRGFLQEYYADSTEEFTPRSPHNIAVTAFGRMGFAGLASWGFLCAVIARQTLRALRKSEDPEAWALWCSIWAILVSATFGVVLEGPMGAVLFWSLLALAHTTAAPDAANREAAT